jgi:hypothetical protein
MLASRDTSVIVASRKLPDGKAVESMVARRAINTWSKDDPRGTYSAIYLRRISSGGTCEGRVLHQS